MLTKFAGESEAKHFAPHSFELKALQALATNEGQDLYFVAYAKYPSEARVICGYGMLRGWDEGFTIPSLGIFIDQAYRGHGFGRRFMQFLHTAAKRRGAHQVRLTVNVGNESAVALYRSLGYNFKEMPESNSRFVGIVSLS